jgi:hypothetical protein
MANGLWLIAGPKGKARRPEKVYLVCLPSFFAERRPAPSHVRYSERTY